MAAPVTNDEIDQIRRLHADGLSRNAIAKQVGRSVETVSRVAARLGLSFDRARTKEATAAVVADAKARRAALALALIGDAERLRSQLWVQTEYRDHGGRDFVEARWMQDEPTAADKLKLMQAAGLAVDRSLRLEQHDTDSQGLAAVDQWLKTMFGRDAE